MRSSTTTALGALALSILSWACSSPAPREVEQPRPAEPAQAPDTDRSTASKSIEEITVTARKREVRIQEIPLSTEPFSSEDLADQGIVSLSDIGHMVPSLQFDGAIGDTPTPRSDVPVVNDAPFADMYFRHFGVNPTIDTEEDRFSTFSVDVDAASYTLARSYLERGEMIPEEAVRVEEFVNAIRDDAEAPRDAVFGAFAEAFPSPYRPGYHVLHLHLKGREIARAARAPASLVFVIDVSGSMSSENRLGLVKRSLRYLVDELERRDRVAIVAYGDTAAVVLEPTHGAERARILAAIDALAPSGSTNAQAGIVLGYELLSRFRRPGDANRLILCSDGVANAGTSTSGDGILASIREEARRGASISTIGFGMGNYNDILMEELAQKGDGNYYYVDDEREARRVFVENLTGTLQVIAKDVKIQLEFDPDVVSRYRLLGYENRILDRHDFADDTVDAGEIGAGHAVTALYEVKLSGPGDLGSLRVRYKEPEGDASRLFETPLRGPIVRASIDDASPGARLSLVAAAFAEILRGSYWARNLSYDQVRELAAGLPRRLRQREEIRELVALVAIAQRLDRREDRFAGLEIPASFDRVPILATSARAAE